MIEVILLLTILNTVLQVIAVWQRHRQIELKQASNNSRKVS